MPQLEAIVSAGGVEHEGNVHILHPLLASRVERLEALSPRFAAAMQALGDGAIPVHLGTPEQIATLEKHGVTLGAQMSANRIGEFAAIVDPQGGELRAFLVRVSLDRIARLSRRWHDALLPRFASRRAMRVRFETMVDVVLIHEIWGHLVPVAESGSLAGQCPDPRYGEPDVESCVMRRENDLRAELGLRPRQSYYLNQSRPARR